MIKYERQAEQGSYELQLNQETDKGIRFGSGTVVVKLGTVERELIASEMNKVMRRSAAGRKLTASERNNIRRSAALRTAKKGGILIGCRNLANLVNPRRISSFKIMKVRGFEHSNEKIKIDIPDGNKE